eukprot:TRINITY_DN10091_c0_g2_i2.p1 TRINITY_DN10091_c0_g2~~TRINITY_DN10091_c0_g2_i2.p1  ORF type:complete len:410 (+),score=92.84 TRINITY_DN10091_c0_g2_i2:157-1230(+)
MADSEAYTTGGELPGQRQRQRQRRGRGRGRGRAPGRRQRAKLLRGDPLESKDTVVVKGLPASVTEQQVSGRFTAYGEIKEIVGKVTRRDDTKKVFFVTFANPASATQALESHESQIDGVEIAVTPRIDGYTNDPIPVDPCRVFVGRLEGNIDEDRLRQIFGQFGTITAVDMANNRRFAHLTYEAPDGAAAAIGLNNTDLDGQTIRVTPYKERPIPAEKILPPVAMDTTEDKSASTAESRPRKQRREPHPLDRRVFMAGFPIGYKAREVIEAFPGAERVAPKRRVHCVVNFDTVENAQAAVAQSGQMVSWGALVDGNCLQGNARAWSELSGHAWERCSAQLVCVMLVDHQAVFLTRVC